MPQSTPSDASASKRRELVLLHPEQDIQAPENPIRKWHDKSQINKLAENILLVGQLTPIVVVKQPGQQKFTVKRGLRRWLAGLILVECDKEFRLEAIIDPYSADTVKSDLVLEALVDTTLQECIPPLDKAAALAALKEAMASEEIIASACNMTKAEVTQLLSIHYNLGPRAKAYMHPQRPEHDRLDVLNAYLISQVIDEEKQFVLADERVTDGMTTKLICEQIARETDKSVAYRAPSTMGRFQEHTAHLRKMERILKNLENKLSTITALELSVTYEGEGLPENSDDLDIKKINGVINELKKFKVLIRGREAF